MSLSYLPFTDTLYDYMLGQRTDAHDPVMEALRNETRALGEIGNMAISPDQCSLMTMLVALTGTKLAMEIGTFTGSSSISIARGLSPGGRLICIDHEFKWTSIARRYWVKAGMQDRIEMRLGNAREQLQRFYSRVPLDFVFIDADKENYDFYYEAVMPFVRPGGLIVLDNMLQGGRVADPMERKSSQVRAIDALNRKLASDRRVLAVMVPVADGLYLCRKR